MKRQQVSINRGSKLKNGEAIRFLKIWKFIRENYCGPAYKATVYCEHCKYHTTEAYYTINLGENKYSLPEIYHHWVTCHGFSPNWSFFERVEREQLKKEIGAIGDCPFFKVKMNKHRQKTLSRKNEN